MVYLNLRKIVTILSIVLGITHAAFAQNSMLNTDADFAQMQREAKESKKGFFIVLVVQQDVDYSKQLLSSVQTTFRGESKLHNLYQGYVMDGFANIDIAQRYGVEYFPAVLVFNSNGQNVGMNDQIFSGAEILSTLTDKKSVVTTLTGENDVAMEDLFYLSKSRGEQEVTINTIKGYEKQSYKNMEARGYGVKVGTYLSFEAFEQELKAYSEKWNSDEIMVYHQIVSGLDQYTIVLGNYTHVEDAKATQKNIRQVFSNNLVRVLDLNNLKPIIK